MAIDVDFTAEYHSTPMQHAKEANDGKVSNFFEHKNFETVLWYYKASLKYNLKNLTNQIEKKLLDDNKSQYIVPKLLFTDLNPSMLSIPFAEVVWKTKADSVDTLLNYCEDKYFPPSFGWYVGYLMSIAFYKDDVAAKLAETIRKYDPVAKCMKAFLMLAAGLPDVAARLNKLHKIVSGGPILGETMEKDMREELEIQEDIEKHDELNPVLFDETGKLRAEIKEKALAISDELVQILNESDVKLVLKDLVITGSNASYNYTKDSDVDLHLVADTSTFEDPDGLYPIIYNAFKSAFNKKYDIYFYDVPVEVYIESTDTPLVSNGIYSVMYDKWIKEPTKDDIPEVDMTEIDSEVAPWEERYKELVAKLENNPDADETEIDDFIDELYVLRGEGLKEGEYAIGNLVFKEMRNRGYMDKLKELRDKIVTAKLSLTDLQEDLKGRELDFYRQEIQRLTHQQPIIQPNGLFELYNVKEDDARFILNILRRQDFVEYAQMSASRFDFQTMSRMGRPAQYYRIIGQLRA